MQLQLSTTARDSQRAKLHAVHFKTLLEKGAWLGTAVSPYVCTLFPLWWFVPCINNVIHSFANLHCSGLIRPVMGLLHHQYMVPAFCSPSLVWWQIALALAMQKTVDQGWKCLFSISRSTKYHICGSNDGLFWLLMAFAGRRKNECQPTVHRQLHAFYNWLC